MKTGKDLIQLAREIERQKTAKRDFIADTAGLSFSAPDDWTPPAQEKQTIRRGQPRPVMTAPRPAPIWLNIPDQGRFEVGPVAHGQVSAYTGIPKKYYDRMQAYAPDLLAANVNQWFTQAPAPRMVRTLDSRARAFLSNRYRILDHEDVLQAVLPALSDAGLGAADIISCEVTERKLYLKALFPKVMGEIKKGDVVQAGIVISNSELGLGAVDAQALVYRLSCSNGAITLDHNLKKYHVGREIGGGGNDDTYEYYKDDTRQAIDSAFMRKLRDTVAAAAQQATFTKILDRWKEATGRTVADPIGAVQEIQKRYTLTDGDRKGILSHLISGGDLSQYGIVNAVTRYSQDVEDYDTATDLEKIGGTLIDLAPGDWKTIAEAEAA